jgi:hypothetical protein
MATIARAVIIVSIENKVSRRCASFPEIRAMSGPVAEGTRLAHTDALGGERG